MVSLRVPRVCKTCHAEPEAKHLRALAQLNPMTYAVDATRSLLISGWDWGLVGAMVAALLAFDVVTLGIASLVLRQGLAE